MNDEKELLNLRNQRIQLINENQIIDSDLQKNQLFYEEIANQKKILKANLESSNILLTQFLNKSNFKMK